MKWKITLVKLAMFRRARRLLLIELFCYLWRKQSAILAGRSSSLDLFLTLFTSTGCVYSMRTVAFFFLAVSSETREPFSPILLLSPKSGLNSETYVFGN